MDVGNQESVEGKPLNRTETITKIIFKDFDFLETCKDITTDQFLLATAQLCHMDANLAEHVWLQSFPKLWAILEEHQKNVRSFCFVIILFRVCFVLDFSTGNVAFCYIKQPSYSKRQSSKCY